MEHIDYSKFKIIDYNKSYADLIDNMEINQWGVWGEESIDEFVGENEIIRVALYNNEFAGVAYGNIEDSNCFWIDVICLVPKFQKCGFGTLILNDIIKTAKTRFKIKKIKTESVYVNGHSNSKKLLENRGFKVYKTSEKGYWGKLYPDVFCTECSHCPCECTTLFYELEL